MDEFDAVSRLKDLLIQSLANGARTNRLELRNEDDGFARSYNQFTAMDTPLYEWPPHDIDRQIARIAEAWTELVKRSVYPWEKMVLTVRDDGSAEATYTYPKFLRVLPEMVTSELTAIMEKVKKEMDVPRPVDVEVFIRQSIATVKRAVAKHDIDWGLHQARSWRLDRECGRIFFKSRKRGPSSARAQVVGFYDLRDASFRWGWDEQDLPPSMQEHARLARDWGKLHGMYEWYQGRVLCTVEDVWAFTAVAARLGNADAAFRALEGDYVLHLTVTEFEVETGPRYVGGDA